MKTLPVFAVALILTQSQQAPPQNPPSQATPPAQGAQPPQGGPGGRGGFNMRAASPVPYDDYTGFTKLWDGATFKNWDGESPTCGRSRTACSTPTRRRRRASTTFTTSGPAR